MWVARDKNGELNLFSLVYPERREGYYWSNESTDYQGSKEEHSTLLDSRLFPNLTWENEPIEVEILKKPIQVIINNSICYYDHIEFPK